MKNMLFLLCALIVVPAWAAETTPTPASGVSSAQTVQPAKTKARKHKKKTAKKAAATATPVSPLSCLSQTCGGVPGCYLSRCGATCTGC